MATKTYTLKAVADKAAELSDKDAVKVGKEIRGRIRRNFDDLVEQGWESLSESKANRDGNRYPPMPAKIAKVLLAPYQAKAVEEGDDEEDTDEDDESEDE